MPRGNPQNLRPASSSEQARERGRKGGIASGKSRRNKIMLRDCLEALLEAKITNEDGKKITGAEALSAELFQKALSGDTKAWEILRDTAGQKPIDKVEQVNIDGEYLAKVEELKELFYGKGTD